MLRSRGAWLPTREKEEGVRVVEQGGTVRSYPALVMPHPPGLRLLRFSRGLSGAATSLARLWCKGRKGSSENGAFSRST